MTDLLNLGLSGLTAYRGAMSAVSENVTNAETPGFARRSVRLAPGLDGGATTDPIYRENLQFGGVRATALVRNWDEFRAAEARHAAASAGRGEVREQWFTAIETALDDGPAGIGSRITGFFNAADVLAASPADPLNRNKFLLALDQVAASFRRTSESLRRTTDGIGDAAELEVQKLNQTLTALGNINTALLTAPAGGAARATLEDQRDRLIDVVASDLDVVTTYKQNGAVQIDLAEAPGGTLITSNFVGSFSLAPAGGGALRLSVSSATGVAVLSPMSGRMAGFLDSAAAAAGRAFDLNGLAADFVADINAWSAAGRDASGNPGPALLTVPAAADTMRALVTDPALVPAASPSGVPNGNLLTLQALRGDTGAEKRWAGIVSNQAQKLAATKSESAAAKAWRDSSLAALDETTGIDLDREAADLMRYQQAYSACARIVQVGRETVDALLRIF